MREQLQQLQIMGERQAPTAVARPAPPAADSRDPEAHPRARAGRGVQIRSAPSTARPRSRRTRVISSFSASSAVHERRPCGGCSAARRRAAPPARAARTSGPCRTESAEATATSSSRSGQYGLATRSLSRYCAASPRSRARHPASGTTNAQARSPRRSSGIATIATSRTAGCRYSSCSISATGTFSPPRLITSLTRPVICR